MIQFICLHKNLIGNRLTGFVKFLLNFTKNILSELTTIKLKTHLEN